MEVDRKRASDGDVPDAKRVSLDEPVNAEDVGVFQKDALFRQMTAYRRERDELQAQLQAASQGDDALKAELRKLTEQYVDAQRQLERQQSSSVAKLLHQGKPAEPAKSETPPTAETAANGATGGDPKEILKLKDALAASEGEVAQLKQTVDTLDQKRRENEQAMRDLQERLAVLPTAVQAAEHALGVAQRDAQKLAQETQALQQTLADIRGGQAEFEQAAREKAATLVANLERRATAAEADVARIRAHRDELLSETNVLKADNARQKNELARAQELAELSENEKNVKNEVEAARVTPPASGTGEDLPTTVEALTERCTVLLKQNRALQSEIGSLEQGFARANAKAKQAVKATAAVEQKLGVLNSAKVRSDEKYLGAMRAKDADAQELARSRAALARSAEVVAEQKAVEQRLTAQATRLLKQIAQHETDVQRERRDADSARRQRQEAEALVAQVRAQLAAVREQVVEQETQRHAADVARRHAETKIEKLDRQIDAQRAISGLGSSADVQEQLESLRSIAMCPVCQKNWKNRALTTCGHTMCEDCVQSRLAARMRKCPMCNGHFASNDVLAIHL